MQEQAYLTVKEAAELLKVPEERIRDHLRQGTLLGRKVRRQWMVNRKALEEWKRQQGTGKAGA